MPTEIIKTIKPDGTGDYITLAAWSAANAANLVSLDQIRIAEVYGSGNVGGVNLAGWTTDATHYPWIRAAAGEGHAGIWDTSKAYVETTSDSASSILSNNCYSKITGMQIKLNGGNGNVGAVGTYLGSVAVDRCILISNNTLGLIYGLMNWGNSGGIYSSVTNSIIIIRGSATASARYGIGVFNGGLVNAYNNTIHVENNSSSAADALAQGIGGGFGDKIYSQNNYLSATNCYHAYDLGGGGVLSKGDHDATSTNEALTAALRNIAYSSINFINVTSGAEDLHTKVASILYAGGVDISGIIQDIDGETRPSPPSIGADDIIVAIIGSPLFMILW